MASAFNDTSEQQWTALHDAAKNGEIETVSDLLTIGVDVNVQDKEQRTPLHWAAQNGHYQTVSALLAAGANDFTRDNMKRTPLHLAAEKGDHKTVSALLTAPLRSRDWRERTPLHQAAENGNHETVSALLEAGADVNTLDSELKTPLHWAAENGHHEAVLALMTAGAELYRRDREHKTPLQYATEQGHIECVEALLGHSADIDDRNMELRVPVQVRVPVQESRPLRLSGQDYQASPSEAHSLLNAWVDRTPKTLRKPDVEAFQSESWSPITEPPENEPLGFLEYRLHPTMQLHPRMELARGTTLATLTVERLQCFKDKQAIQFHLNSTAILGPNSSGKSISLRAWLLFATLSRKMSNRRQQTISNSVITDVFAISDIRDFWYNRDTIEPVTVSGTDMEGHNVHFTIDYEMGGAYVKVHKRSSRLIEHSHNIVLAVLNAVSRDAYKPQVPEEVPFSEFPVLTLDQSLVFNMLHELEQHPIYWNLFGKMLHSVRPVCAIRFVSGGRQRGQKVVMVQEGSANIPLQICDSSLLQIVSVLAFVLHSLKCFGLGVCDYCGRFRHHYHHLGDVPTTTLLLDDIGCFLEPEIFRKLVICLTSEVKCQIVVTTLWLEVAKECDKYIDLRGPNPPKTFPREVDM